MLPFIPRKVARNAAKTQVQTPRSKPTDDATTSEQVAGPSQIHSQTPANIDAVTLPPLKGKEREVDPSRPNTLSDDAYAALLKLSLSDHALWLDANLRRVVESSSEGYIPLMHIVKHSSYLSSITPPPSEAILVKALRACASELFDLRVLFSEPSRAMWYGRTSGANDSAGGYEIRLKDWEGASHQARNSNREEWESKTFYMENIPLQYRSIPGIYQFTTSVLLRNNTLPASCVQSISLPRHHQDKPTDQPKCKGFALVTLSSPDHVARLVEEWPWQRRRNAKSMEQPNADLQDAVKFGFRVLKKARWDQLKEEYLARRHQLLEQIRAAQAQLNQREMDMDEDDQEDFAHAPPPKRKRTPSPAPEEEEMQTENENVEAGPVTTLWSPYPYGCLVFVKNVHPETNKTTLKTLFSSAFRPDAGWTTGDGLDYVDFTKGMDTCYLRLATPTHTAQLITHFSEHLTIQTSGLDNAGSTSDSPSPSKPVMMERVEGTREELYWGKVPEKVRRGAVEKAVKGVGASQEGGDEEREGGAGKRKRRKR
ncbi:hypothetical protein EIP91_008518 [Steccherinum ochraceum]|uniref:XRRM domain-containing protein n=1 Tax=Steccherinum ochraceum TaxID=92696 RepID=A0A4V2MV84_9APHY|nr:hypothetical protein EIP91_008518 [Steccherinum ochraceum]